MRLRASTAAALMFASSVAVSCTGTSDDVTAEEARGVAAIGQESASALAAGLIQRLTAALQEGGPEYAVSFCSQEALALTAAIERDLSEGIQLKRTSTKYRNPRNAPDDLESVAIQYFENALADGQELPQFFVQRASPSEFRYYQPLMVNDMCLQCHGSADRVPPAVNQALQAAYPDDRATGYAAGDLRGVIRVTVPAAMLEGT